MATATSAVNAAIAGLVSLVQAAVTTADPTNKVLVVEGPPGPNQPDDMVIIAERVNQTYDPHNLRGDMGSGALYEKIEISVHIDCYVGGDTFATARARCLVLSKAVDDAVRNDPTLSSSVLLSRPSSHSYEAMWDEDHKGTRVTCDMFVYAEASP